MPVLPAVPSTTSPPGFNSPRFSASRIIWRPARSFTEPPGFMNSALPRIVQPVACEAALSLISGVWPIASTRPSVCMGCPAFSRNGTHIIEPRGPDKRHRQPADPPGICDLQTVQNPSRQSRRQTKPATELARAFQHERSALPQLLMSHAVLGPDHAKRHRHLVVLVEH